MVATSIGENYVGFFVNRECPLGFRRFATVTTNSWTAVFRESSLKLLNRQNWWLGATLAFIKGRSLLRKRAEKTSTSTASLFGYHRV